MKKYFFLLLVAHSSWLAAISQNVGIGTSNPLNKLHVAGGFRLDTLTGVGGSGLLRHDANGVVYGLKFTGNITDVLRGDGTFGTGGVGLTGWSLTGNTGTNPSTNFIGTTDNLQLRFRVNNSWAGQLDLDKNNYSFGLSALQSNTTGTQNVGFGRWALLSNTTGSFNTSVGTDALSRNTSGSSNTAVGNWALILNTTGNDNTGIGNNALQSNTEGSSNTGIGHWALFNNTSGTRNTAVGDQALSRNSTYNTYRGDDNTAVGYYALLSNTYGFENTAIGSGALYSNTTAIRNTATGFEALKFSDGDYNCAYGYNALTNNQQGKFNNAFGSSTLSANNGNSNSAFGYAALFNNTTGYSNVAIGIRALYGNTIASNLVAIGDSALYNNDEFSLNNTAVGSKALFGDINNGSGTFNTAIGSLALQRNYGHANTALGTEALNNNVQGFENTGIGSATLSQNVSGTGNVALGYYAGIYPTCSSCSNNIMIGYQTYSTGSGNIVIGFKAGVRNGGTNAIAIGNEIQPTINEISIGNSSHVACFVQGIYPATTSFAPNVYVESNGQLMRVTSSARYKEDINDLEINTTKIYDLRPVSYTSKTDKTRHFGLIAEEVAQTIPELANYAREKDVIKGSESEKLIPDAVQYPLLSVLLLKEVQKHEKQITEQQQHIEDQNKKINALQQQVDELMKAMQALKTQPQQSK